MPYFVYVIKLDKKVLKSKKFRQANPTMKRRKACFYVGQTCRDPEIRFQQHKQGYKSNGFVKRFGLKLKPRIYHKYNPIKTRKEAEIVEQQLTEKLRNRGYGVWSN
jgi:hypothetical protein